MIVGSILLAFGIQAWWDETQERDRTAAHLEALAEEIGDARGALLENIEREAERIEAIRSLLNAMASTGPDQPSTEIVAWLGIMWGAATPVRPLAALDDLRESGVLALIESDELRLALFGYERHTEQLIEIGERAVRAWEEELRPYLVAHTDVLRQQQTRDRGLGRLVSEFQPVFDSDVDNLLDDRTFQNLLLVRLVRVGSASNNLETALGLLDKIAGLIESELQAQ